jgi:hypothetical protein
MGGDSKAGNKSSTVTLDPRMEQASLDALDYGALVSQMPALPNRGTTIAAMAPGQNDARNNIGDAAAALGLRNSSSDTYLPPAERGSGGFLGYSSGQTYDDMRNASVSQPMQNSMNALFADPTTGQASQGNSPLFQGLYGGGKGGESAGGVGGQSGGAYGGSNGINGDFDAGYDDSGNFNDGSLDAFGGPGRDIDSDNDSMFSGMGGGIGRGIGGAIGTAFGGPVGGALGSALGGAIGDGVGGGNSSAGK